LTGSEALMNAEIAQILSDELGREIRYINLPPLQLREALLSAGVPEWNADALLDLQRLYSEGKAASVTGTSSRFSAANQSPLLGSSETTETLLRCGRLVEERGTRFSSGFETHERCPRKVCSSF
jgi:hypothetical protein